MEDIFFAGHWLSEFGGRLTASPQKEIAEYDYEMIEIPGRSGNIYLDNNRYKNVPMQREINLVNKTRIRSSQQVDKFLDWIAYARGYQEFRDTLHPRASTRAVLQNIGEVVREIPRLHRSVLSFDREPFWYSDDGQIYRQARLTDNKYTVELINPYGLAAAASYQISMQPCTASIRISVNGSIAYYENLTFSAELNSLFIDGKNQQVMLKNGATIRRLNVDEPAALAPNEKNIVEIYFADSSSLQYVTSVRACPNWRFL